MGDTAKDPVFEPDNLHVTGTETEQIGTKNLHVTSEPADAIADKVLGDKGPQGNLHVTSEPSH